MKKRISIIAIIAVLSILMVSVFAGCQVKLTTEEGVEYLNECVKNTKDNSKINEEGSSDAEYYLRVVQVLSDGSNSLNNTTKEILINIAKDDPKTEYKNEAAAKMTLITSKGVDKQYEQKVWGDSLKKGVKAKKATDADWKKGVMFASEDGKTFAKEYTEMSLYQFLDMKELQGYGMQDIMGDMETFLASEEGKAPDDVIRQGEVTTYTYKNIGKTNAELFGSSADKDGNYPLTVETVSGHVSKIIDMPTGGTIKLYITMKGPNIKVPVWE